MKRGTRLGLSIQEILLILLALVLLVFFIEILTVAILIILPAIIIYLLVEPNIKNKTIKKIIWIVYLVLVLAFAIKMLLTNFLNLGLVGIAILLLVWILLRKN